MPVNNYDPATSKSAYFPEGSRDLYRLFAREKTLHDWADFGSLEFFEGPGDNPTLLPDYAIDKLWLRADPGVTDTVGTVRGYDAVTAGAPTLLASWPMLNREGFIRHIGGASIDSPAFTGSPTSTAPPSGDDSNRIATTGWLQAEVDLSRNILATGSEYLYQWLAKLLAGTAAKIVVSGDSTAAPLSVVLGPLATQRYGAVTVVTNGFSGEHTGQWNATRVATDIAAAPDLYIWHWGMNDCTGLGRTPAQFNTDMRAGLATFRASRPIGTSGIVLMTPNAAGDNANGRNEAQAAALRPLIRQAAIDFDCAYFDTSGLYNDGTVGGAAGWLDAILVHPDTAHNQAIAGALLDLIVPPGMRLSAEGLGVGNPASTAPGGSPLASAAPSAFPRGISIKRATAANGWPQDGAVQTHYYLENTFPMQVNWAFSGVLPPLIRKYDQGGAAWGEWSVLGNGWTILPAVTATAADLITAYVAGGNLHRATPAAGWPLDGYVMTNRIGSTGIQWTWAYSGATSVLQMRTYNQGGSAWNAWVVLLPSNTVVSVTPAAGFTAPGSDGMVSILETNGMVTGDGYLTMTTPGTIAAGTLIATLPAGHYPINSWRTVELTFWTGGATGTASSWVTARAQISPSTGQITMLDAVGVSIERAYFSSGARWRHS